MVVYLNNAAGAHPKAPGVVEAVCAAMGEPPYTPGRAAGPGRDVVAQCRQLLADLLHVSDPSRIVLTYSGTHALNLALLGLAGSAPLRAVTSVLEHNSVLRPLQHLRQRSGGWVEHVSLQPDGELDRKSFDRALDRAPDLVVLTHASNVTGQLLDVAPLFRLARAAGARTVLDASQSAGNVVIDAAAIEADLIALTGHKGLAGPSGTGALYVSPQVELAQWMVGGTGVLSEASTHPLQMPMRLEAGTPNVPAIAGWAAALRWEKAHGDAARQAMQRARSRLREGLAAIDAVRLFEGTAGASHVGIVSFQLAGWPVNEAAWVLQESFGILSRSGLHCAPLIHEAMGAGRQGTIRLSVSPFTTDNDVDQVLAAVGRMRR